MTLKFKFIWPHTANNYIERGGSHSFVDSLQMKKN